MARILAVDKDAHYRALIQDALASDRHWVAIAEGGASAFHQIMRWQVIDLVIIDSQIDYQDLFNTCRKMLREPRAVLIMTEVDSVDRWTICDNVLIVGRLQKPFSREQVRLAVSDLLSLVDVTHIPIGGYRG